MSEKKTTGIVSRRNFLGAATLLTTGLLLEGPVLSAATWNQGRHLPVPFPHFPSNVHAFIWRNWQLVPLEKLAAILEASPEDVRQLAQKMGLPAHVPVSKDQWSRSYITIIRRNWHLLPKKQLQDLLGWTEEHLEFTLQEDDFLNVKLGNLKPDCEPLKYRPATAEIRKAEEWFANTVKTELAKGVAGPVEPLFHFVNELSAAPSKVASPLPSGFSPRYGYAYFMLFGDPLLDAEIDPYPEGYLARMAASGMDGTWMHIVLSKLTPFPWDPQLSENWEKRLENLKKLVARCKKYGIGIYLYLNEPRYQPLAFYEKHPELKGVTRGNLASLCTSHPDVQKYLVDSIAHITSVVPDLAGFFSITASENPTNCWSHFQGAQCPRCAGRGPAAVISELNTLYREGIRKGVEKYRSTIDASYKGEGPRLIVWDWGWRDDWAAGIVPGLPKDAALMSVSEWELPIERGGVKAQVGEYSISAVGPGPRAKRHWAIAREHGLKIIAKIQAGTTWELGGVPYIPAVENVAQHAVNLRNEEVSGLMTGWTLGGYPGSPNLEVVSAVGSDPKITVAEAMNKVAANRYGKAAGHMVEAWMGFSKAFREFPYHIGVVYSSPVHSGPANLLWAKPTGYKATMVGIGYDDLDSWRAVYPEDVFIKQLYKVADGFDAALESLRAKTKALRLSDGQQKALRQECQVAEAVALHYRSVANQSEFIRLRKQLVSPADKTRAVGEIKRLLKEEITLAKRMYALQSIDSRLGFEASNHYFYIPGDLREKVMNCRYLLDFWIDTV